ncbi:hypothetical protein M0805_004010 [Coniferiporia weirii]|nr:hypothetical protein M0805_004010 [Coniferiporia weirii]
MSTAQSRRTTSSARANVLNNLDHPSNLSPTPRTQEHVPSPIREGHVLKDTSAKTCFVDHSSYQAGIVDEKRSSVLDDLGRAIPEISLEFFLDNTLPPPRDGLKPSEIVDTLKRDGCITDRYWKLFETEPRCMQGTRDQSVLDHLADLLSMIVRKADERSHNHTQTLVLRTDLNSTPSSETDIVNRPGGCMFLNVAEGSKASWYGSGLTMGVKDGERMGFRDDVIGKQKFNMQHLMSLDPCRRSTFGITIEKFNMRLWSCSRAVVLVNRCFNFRMDLETLVHIFLSFAFASKTELGRDPTISVTTENNIRLYHFTIKNENLIRVFKVKKDGTLAVPKDVWINDDCKSEHEVRSRILADIQKKFGEYVRKGGAKYLLIPIAYDFVKVDDRADHTTKVLMRGAVPSLSQTFDFIIMKPVFKDARCSTEFSQASHRIAYQVMRGPRELIHHRDHYRTVFREIGLPLHQVKKLSDVFSVLEDVSGVLEYIHGCGWVHRNISDGNVCLYDNGRGLLGDSEYAKKVDTDAEREVRTGTGAFMAIEVESQEYKFTSEKEEGTREVRQYESRIDTVMERYEFSDIEEGLGSDSDLTEDLENASGPDMDEDSSDVDESLNKAEDSMDELHEDLDGAERQPRDANEGQGANTTEDLCGQHNDKEVDFLKKSMNTTEVLINSDKRYTPPVFFIRLVYNCLHDMESIWWTAIWIPFLHEDSSEKSRRSEADRLGQVETANMLFPQQLYSTKRHDFFTSGFAFDRRTWCLPQSFKDVVEHLGSLRGMLRIRNTQAEATLPKIDKKAFKRVHGVFAQTLRATRDEAYNIEIERIVKSSEAPALAKSVRLWGFTFIN